MTTPLLSDSWSDFRTAEEPYGNTTEQPLESFAFYIARQYLWTIYGPFLFLFGIFGNVMIIIIMRRATSGESTIHIYFAATAVFDLVYLLSGPLSQWMVFSFGFSINATHNVVCKINTWLHAGGSTISAWCLVCMTVHRAVSVVWPHRVNVLCTRRAVILALTGISVFIALMYSHAMIGFERVYSVSSRRYWCSVRHDNESYTYLLSIFGYFVLLSYCVLPSIFIVLSNSVLIWKLSMSVKETNRKLTRGDFEQVQSRQKAANSVALTIIVVSLAFIVFTLPSSIDFALNFLTISHSRVSGYELAKKSFIYTVCEVLSGTNSAMNFYLYCLTGRRFREEFIKVWSCGRSRRRRGKIFSDGDATEKSTR